MPSDSAFLTHRRILHLVLLVALALRLGWALTRPADDASLADLPDQREYVELGRNLLAGTGLSFFDDRFEQTIHAYRMPGYPGLVAACGGNLVATRAVQAILDTSTVLAAALLAGMLLPATQAARGRWIAAAFVALNPFLVYFCGLLLAETLYTAMLAWGVVLLLAGARGGRLAPEPPNRHDVETQSLALRPWRGTALWLAGAIVLACSGLVRPSAMPLTVVLGICVGFAARPRNRAVPAFRPRWPLPVAATMLFWSALVLTPWAYRNSLVLERWIWTTTNAGVTAYDGFNPDATGASDQNVLKSLPQLRTMNEVERSEYLSARAGRFMRENPRRAVVLAAVKAGRTWTPVPLSAEFGDWKRRIVAGLFAIPLFALTLLGLLRGDLSRAGKACLLAPAVYFTLVHMASVGSLRYRVPVEPLLAVVAASGLVASGRPVFGWRRAGGGGVGVSE